MNNVDKISKETRLLFESSKDHVTKNLLEAVSKGLLKLDEKQIQSVVSVVGMSLDEGYLRALPNFQNSIKKHL